MDKEQFSKIAMAIKTYYPLESVLPNMQAIELWYNMLSDIPYNVCTAALNKWVATHEWPPKISQLRAMSAEIIRGEKKDWSAAWSEAMSAVIKYGYYAPEEAYACMDEITKETVKRIGYAQLCHSENIEADRANFRMIYETLVERKDREEQLPAKLKEFIEKLQGKLKEIESEEKNNG